MTIESITTQETDRRVMNLFFVVDTSGSMEGRKIATVNQAIRESLPIIKDIADENDDARIKVSVLEFADSADWMYDSPIDADMFEYTDLSTHCLTDFGAALEQLNKKMSRSEFLSEHAYQPVLILLSDGAPTDSRWEHELELLKQNKWYQNAIKVAIAIGDDADESVLKKFLGHDNSEGLLHADNIFELRSIIKIVAVKSSIIGSQSKTASVKTKQELVNEEIKEEIANAIEEGKEEEEKTPDIFEGF